MKDNRKDIRALRIHQNAFDFSNLIWSICMKWDYFAKNSIGIQLVRAVDSISANITEGYGRYFYKENLRFCYYARGSFEETADWLRKSLNRNLISDKNIDNVEEFVDKFPKSLNAYINYIRGCINENWIG